MLADSITVIACRKKSALFSVIVISIKAAYYLNLVFFVVMNG